MKKLSVYVICGVAGALFLANANMAAASELVYTPINPSFGGNPYNGQWLLSQAVAQNPFEEEPDMLEEFRDMLDRQILYRTTRMITEEAFGEEGFRPGRYELGGYVFDISTDGEVITVIITDTATGEITIIEVPYY